MMVTSYSCVGDHNDKINDYIDYGDPSNFVDADDANNSNVNFKQQF